MASFCSSGLASSWTCGIQPLENSRSLPVGHLWRTKSINLVLTLTCLVLGFDPVSNDFKVVANLFRTIMTTSTAGNYNSTESTICLYEMYSLITNSWKRLEEPPLACVDVKSLITDGYLNGVYYWATDGEDQCSSCLILSFNLSAKVFKVFDPPKGALVIMVERDQFDWMVGMYKKCLAVIVNHRTNDLGDQAMCCIDVWVLTKDDEGDCGAWQHLFNIRPTPAFHGLWVRTFRMDGDMLLVIRSESDDGEDEANLYNPSARTFKQLGIAFGTCFRYVRSLFPLSKRHCHDLI